MNLAKMLSIIFLLACACSAVVAARGVDPGPQSSPDKPSASQTQTSQAATKQPSSAVPSTTPQSSSGPTQQQNSKPRTRKHKKAAGSPCASATASTGNGSANAAKAQTPSTTNCPPQKTVVRNGGTSEPEVQLTGGEGAAQSQQRSTTDQLLGSTEDNLKKIADRQLSPAQQDVVVQIRQYIAQSKEAVAAGDTERGRMLAQKAQLLSDELVKP